MSLRLAAPAIPVPHLVSSFLPGWSPIATVFPSLASGGLTGSATPDRALFYPLWVPTACTIRRLFWANGSAVAGNVDAGVYADAGGKPGVRLVSAGTTAQGTASQLQFVTVTALTLPPGLYWLALVGSTSGSGTFFRSAFVYGSDVLGGFQQDSALPLPATATPVEVSENLTYLAAVGFATTASP